MQGLSLWQITGKDIERFLKSQVTGKITKDIQCFCYCNAKGRVCTIGWAFYDENWYLLLPENNTEAMFSAWQPYALLSQISHKKITNWGWAITDKPTKISWQRSHTWLSVATDFTPEQTWTDWALAQTIPIITDTTRWLYTPHMLNAIELDAIDFNKGCYLGQEIIARTQHLGQQKRFLKTFTLTEPLTDKAIFAENGTKIGEIIFNNDKLAQAIANKASRYFLANKQELMLWPHSGK